MFALAASVAILIYLEIPRVAFERQRDKEALLIDRGEQYARAIELFARKMNKNPQTLEDLEQAQTVRFLRRRYKDPMTGKDEWRLIHVNAVGQYIDSKVHKAASLDQKGSGPSILASKIQGVGESATVISQEGQVSAALQKRASDRISPGSPAGSGGGVNPGQSGAAEGNPDPNQDPSQQQNNAAATGANPNAQNAAGSGGQAGTPAFGSVLPGAQQDASGAASTMAGTGQQLQTIQSILGSQRTGPSPGGGQPGVGQGGVGPSANIGAPSALGPGLVGVATTVEMEGIRNYKEHSNYSEWEFIFDPREMQGKGQIPGTQQGAGTNALNPGSSFGGMPAGGTPAPPSGGRFN